MMQTHHKTRTLTLSDLLAMQSNLRACLQDCTSEAWGEIISYDMEDVDKKIERVKRGEQVVEYYDTFYKCWCDA